MVLPNTRIYSFAYISRQGYSRIRAKLDELEKLTNTEITFDSRSQYFGVKARSQKTCDEVEKLIVDKLLPVLNRSIDYNHFIDGVAPDLSEDLTWMQGVSKDGYPANQSRSASDNDMDDSSSEDEDDDDSYDSGDSFYDNLPGAKQKKIAKAKAKAEKEDAKSRIMVKKNEAHEKFIIAKNIKDIDDLLYGPPMLHMAEADYLQVVGDDTNTECSLNGRQINIFGATNASVKDALTRFQTIQRIYKRCRGQTTVVPCVHYSQESPRYGIRFCPLNSYRHQSIVCNPSDDNNACVLVPVFKDASGKSIKPPDMIDDDALNQQMEELTQRFNRASASSPKQPPPTRQQPSWSSPRQPNRQSSSPPGFITPGRTTTPAGQAPLWGENRFTVNVSSKGQRGNANSTPASSSWATPTSTPPADELFPELPSSTRKPTKASAKTGKRRVLRLNPQKAAPAANSPSTSTLSLTRQYNLNNIKDALSEGLESARTFRGEVTLNAKIGKVLWRNLPENVKKTDWGMFDLKDLVMKEHKTMPEFNNMALVSDAIRDKFLSVLPKPFARSAHYEMHVSARTRHKQPWKPAVMYIESSGAKCYRVDLLQHALTEVDWISLDRKYDFQIQLGVKEIGRPAVKPFVSFVRRIALRPSQDGATTNHLAYENVPDLLTVNDIFHKDMRKFRLGPEHVLHMTRVEKVEKVRDYESVTPKFVAKGSGQVWYDIEVFHIPHEQLFQVNQDKQVGVPAAWTVQDVFGANDSRLEKFIVTMLDLVNRLEKCCA